MRTFLWVVLSINQLALILIAAVKLNRYELTEFAFKEELTGYTGQQIKLHRTLHKALPKVRLLQMTELVILFSSLTTLLVHLNRPVVGLLLALVSACVSVVIIRFQFIQNIAEKLFNVSLEVILKVTEILQPLWVVLGVPRRKELLQPHSLAEFTDQLRRLPSTVISPLQRQRLETLLESDQKVVKDIMTPKKQIIMVEPSAVLGPIVLSDLQKSGHGHFPVATKKGEPEGILTLSDVSDIQLAKQRSSVRELMSVHVSWVNEDYSVQELAQLFLQEKQYIILVKNEDEEFSGMVTITDLMKHLVGIVKD